MARRRAVRTTRRIPPHVHCGFARCVNWVDSTFRIFCHMVAQRLACATALPSWHPRPLARPFSLLGTRSPVTPHHSRRGNGHGRLDVARSSDRGGRGPPLVGSQGAAAGEVTRQRGQPPACDSVIGAPATYAFIDPAAYLCSDNCRLTVSSLFSPPLLPPGGPVAR